jgi:hypothetical protein
MSISEPSTPLFLFKMKLSSILHFLAVMVLCALAVPAEAQPLENAVFTLGTATIDKQGRSWAYVVLEPTEPELLRSRKIAVYSKAGDPGAAESYVRQSIFGIETETAVIQALLNRSVFLGDDLALLETRVDNLFAAVLPDKNLDLATKLSIVIRGAFDTPDRFGNLILLGRLHPAVTFALGLGHAQVVPNGKTTFEIRDFDYAANKDIGVLGRVTISSGAPLIMPAPGKPVLVPDASGKGHLNAKFRWASPPELRRVALLSQGFDLFRVPRQAAEAAGFHTTTPTIAQLKANPSVVVVNQQPIFKKRDYDTDLQAADLGLDPTTFFIADDNGLARPRPPGVPAVRFENGEQFYYFVAARDLLSRDGYISPGTLVTLCDRVPPYAPHMPKVENDYTYLNSTEVQWLKISWRPVTNIDAGKHVSGYYVYRWSSPSETLLFADNPALHRISAMIPHIDGKVNYSYIDSGAGAPSTPADFDKTYWYTVRAIDDGACDGGNYSANSPASFGVLRDRIGPDAPTGGPIIICCHPEVIAGKRDQGRLDPADMVDTNMVPMDIVCKRLDRDVAWAEFTFTVINRTTNFLGRFNFAPNSDEIVHRHLVTRDSIANTGGQRVFCRVGDAQGSISPIVDVSTEGMPGIDVVTIFPFTTLTFCQPVRVISAENDTRPRTCTTHRPQPPSNGGVVTNSGIDVVIQLTPGTKEFKLYRRVDFGPLTLIKQGPGDYSTVTSIVANDRSMPANAATICYFAQLFDENGNASPMAQIGPCIEIDMPTATPLLNPLAAQGDAANPQMGIRWFCSPVGIERFQVLVSLLPGALPSVITPDIAADSATHPYMLAPNPAKPLIKRDFAIYETPAPGLNFGPGPEFNLVVPINLGVKYTVQIRTVAKGGSVSKSSKFQTFLWKAPPKAVGPEVPWPQAPLAALGDTPSTVYAQRLADSVYPGVGVTIGKIIRQQLASNTNGTLRPNLKTTVKSSDIVFKDDQGDSLFPLALYRYQVASAGFPKVSRDLTQVTPMMESIALTPGFDTFQQPCMNWKEPFALMVNASSEKLFNPVFLLDTQPVIHGARYVYLLVRFGDDGEPKEILPTPPVDILP